MTASRTVLVAVTVTAPTKTVLPSAAEVTSMVAADAYLGVSRPGGWKVTSVEAGAEDGLRAELARRAESYGRDATVFWQAARGEREPVVSAEVDGLWAASYSSTADELRRLAVWKPGQ